jgi:uncharacterized OB-fold protein
MSEADVHDSGDAPTETIEMRFATDEVSKPFWANLAAGRLVLPRCRDCGSVFFFPRRLCPTCWSDAIEWVPSTGAGTVFARSEVHVAFQGISPADLPFSVALIDLDDGVRMPGRLDHGELEPEIQIGDRVQLRFSDDPMFELPRFVRQE